MSSTVRRSDDSIAREIVTFTVNVAKRNPVKLSLYFLGLLICLFFRGLSVPDQNLQSYEKEMNKLYIQKDKLLDQVANVLILEIKT